MKKTMMIFMLPLMILFLTGCSDKMTCSYDDGFEKIDIVFTFNNNDRATKASAVVEITNDDKDSLKRSLDIVKKEGLELDLMTCEKPTGKISGKKLTIKCPSLDFYDEFEDSSYDSIRKTLEDEKFTCK